MRYNIGEEEYLYKSKSTYTIYILMCQDIGASMN